MARVENNGMHKTLILRAIMKRRFKQAGFGKTGLLYAASDPIMIED
jgi:hypothetical protein